MKNISIPFLCFAGFAAGVLGVTSCASSSAKPSVEASSEAESAPPTNLPSAYVAPVAVFELRVLDFDKQVRVVDKPTLAALDFAAYFSNPIRMAGLDEKPENYTGKMAGAKVAEPSHSQG